MAQILKCPTRDELVRLNDDELPGDLSESLFDHIESCERCSSIYGELDDPPDNLGSRFAHISPEDLEKAREDIEADVLRDTAASLFPKLSGLMRQRELQPALHPPCDVRDYRVLRRIGSGGMGEVYEAKHVLSGRHDAIKVIRRFRQDAPAAEERFLKEIRTVAQLNHPNVVITHSPWREPDGNLYLAQELLKGKSLQELVDLGEFGGPKEIIDAMIGTCRGLEHAHTKKILHRDIKPANVMRLEDGTIKVIDFGLASAAESGESAILVGAGTVGYMSPEQAHGTEPLDDRSDIYSAGRMLKYLLAKTPIASASKRQIRAARKLEALADWMTHKSPKARPKNITVVISRLEKIRRDLLRSRVKTALAASVILAAAALGIWVIAANYGDNTGGITDRADVQDEVTRQLDARQQQANEAIAKEWNNEIAPRLKRNAAEIRSGMESLSMTIQQEVYRHELSIWEDKSKLIIDGIRKEKLLEELSDVSLSQHSGLLEEERKRLENIQRTCKNQLSELIASFQGISTKQNDKELINTQRQTLINKIDEALNTILVARRESAKKVSATIELDFANKTRPLLTNELRKQLIEIAKQSERVNIPLPKGSLSKLSASNPLHAEYVIEVCRQNPIKDLPRDRVAWFLSFLGKIDNQDAQQELLSILAEITDSSVITESDLSTPETRAAVLQIPGPWNDGLKDMLGRAYLHEPRLDHAKFFDKVATEQIPELGDVSRTDFKLLLAAAVSGSNIAKKRLLDLYTNEEGYLWAMDDLKRLHLLGGALMAEHSSADVRILTQISFAIFRHPGLSSQFSDFLTGWYGVAPASFLDDGTELYLAVESNKKQSRLRNLADQIGQFPTSNEGLRISTIAFLDRVAPGRIQSLIDLDDSPYQSVRVFALSKMIQNGQIASADGQAIANMVIDPCDNQAEDPNTRSRSVKHSEWKFYVDALVSHDKEAAVPVLLKTFLGETKVRASLGAFQTVDELLSNVVSRGEYTLTEINTYRFRAYAAKQATALSNKAAAEILNYGVSDDCPSELRSLALSVAVVSGLPLTSEQKNKLVSRYSESSTNSSRAIQYEKGLVLGLLRLLGEQLQYEEIRREPVETIWGLSDVAWWSGDKNLLSIAEKCREYRGLNLASRERIETRRMPVWTPYHLASEKQLDAVLKQIGDQNAGGDFNTQSILDIQTSIWPDAELPDIAFGLADIRTKVSEETQNRFNHNASIPSFSAWVEFEKKQTCENAENALRSGVAGIAEKDLMLVNSALAIVRRDSETREHAIRTVSKFVDATDFKGIDRDLSRVWRAKVLAQVFDSLLEINKSLKNTEEFSNFNRSVVAEMTNFIDENSD